MSTARERYKEFNRTRERDFIPCVRAWSVGDGREASMVVRTTGSGVCARSVIIRQRGEVIARHSVVTRPDDPHSRSAREVWKALAAEAGIKLPSHADPIQHITMTNAPARGI